MASGVMINGKWRTHTKVTGVQRYAHELVQALEQTDLPCTVVQPRAASRSAQTLWEQCRLPVQASKYRTLFCPANMGPLCLPGHVRLVLTLHCLRFYYHPESYSQSFVSWYRYAIPHLVQRAETILTVSHTASAQIQREYPASRGKVVVIYPGVSRVFREPVPKPNIPSPCGAYWVFVGNASRTKNMGTLIKALGFAHLDHRIVLLGVHQYEVDAYLAKRPHLHRFRSMLVPLGHINEAGRVAQIIGGANGLLAPSLYESFDLPVAEAMACSVPVLASDTQVHREIGDDAPIYLPPTDPAPWGHAMDALVHNPHKASEQGSSGRRVSARYRWDLAAMAVNKVLMGSSNGSHLEH